MKWKGGQWGMNPRILKEERKKNWKPMGSGLTDWQRTTSKADWSGQLMSVFQAILQIHKDNRGMIMQKSSHENKIFQEILKILSSWSSAYDECRFKDYKPLLFLTVFNLSCLCIPGFISHLVAKHGKIEICIKHVSDLGTR